MIGRKGSVVKPLIGGKGKHIKPLVGGKGEIGYAHMYENPKEIIAKKEAMSKHGSLEKKC